MQLDREWERGRFGFCKNEKAILPGLRESKAFRRELHSAHRGKEGRQMPVKKAAKKKTAKKKTAKKKTARKKK